MTAHFVRLHNQTPRKIGVIFFSPLTQRNNCAETTFQHGHISEHTQNGTINQTKAADPTVIQCADTGAET